MTKHEYCTCRRSFTCARCGRRNVQCDSAVNIHALKLCRNCCAAEGIKAIHAARDAAATAALSAPRELAIRQAPRVGMTERAATEEALNDAWAGGRLSEDVYDARMAAAAAAVSQDDLDVLTIDIRPAAPAGPVSRGDRVLTAVTSISPFWLLMILLAISLLTSRR